MKQGAGAHARLHPAVRALPVASSVNDETGMLASTALGTNKAVGPAVMLQRRLALGLGPVDRDELAQGHARLKLDRILWHCSRSTDGHTGSVCACRWLKT